jgi:hypothetical protein
MGIYTLYCLHELTKKEVNFEDFTTILKDKILNQVDLCRTISSVFNGASGYLYMLLLLNKQIEKRFKDTDFAFGEIQSCIYETVKKVVQMIVENNRPKVVDAHVMQEMRKGNVNSKSKTKMKDFFGTKASFTGAKGYGGICYMLCLAIISFP